MNWHIGNTKLASRLLLGSAHYPSPTIFQEAVKVSDVDIVTVSLRREMATDASALQDHPFWEYIKATGCYLLPNTAGCRTIKEAVLTAQMARDVFETDWVKLEVIGDNYTLQPDPFALVEAADTLVKLGFTVLPYCTDDLVLCQRLVDVGCRILMPWAAPIGSGQGVCDPLALKTLRYRLPDVTLIVDAGIGAPSHASRVMEMGYDAVLVNSAVALANDPVRMASAFKWAVKAGYEGFQAGFMPKREFAVPSTPTVGQPFWLQTE